MPICRANLCHNSFLSPSVFIDTLAIFAWGAALQMSEVGFLSNLAYLTPVVAMVVSYVTLGEPIESYAIIGMLFVLGGCLLQIISRKRVDSTKNETNENAK